MLHGAINTLALLEHCGCHCGSPESKVTETFLWVITRSQLKKLEVKRISFRNRVKKHACMAVPQNIQNTLLSIL